MSPEYKILPNLGLLIKQPNDSIQWSVSIANIYVIPIVLERTSNISLAFSLKKLKCSIMLFTSSRERTGHLAILVFV